MIQDTARDLAQSVLAARRRFSQDGAVPDDLVPSPIVRSWRRCAGLGFDMAARPRVEPLAARELRELIERHERLRRLCRPELEALNADANATDSIVILTDSTGMVLDTVGSAGFADCASRVALRPGVIWSETVTGTNAIGTALIERRPIDVRGAEHYFEPHRVLSCSAAPILDPRGELAGVLDLSGHASVHHLHALGLVRLAVDQIEHRLFDHGFERCDVLRLHCDPALIGTPREGILVFEDHRLVAANRYGLALFDLTPEALDISRFSDLFGNGFARLDPQCRLRSHRGHELFARLRRASERATPSRPPRAAAAAAGGPEPWFDAAACTARATAVRLVNADIPVLIHGETGVGKEVFARQIHAHSARATRPFVAVNCAALPESLIESELFGYEEGAFTGARRQGSIGLLRQADGGILFLDEIGDMPLALQARLLRVLQERQVTPLGGGAPVAVDFTVVCATHRNLRELIDSGAFRADLYFRIAQYTVALPPLRSFPDRAAIISALWSQLGGAAAGVTLASDALELLAAYEWPGNFRQLAGMLRALAVLAEPCQPLTPDQLPAEIRQWRAPAGAAAGCPAASAAAPVAAAVALPGRLEEVEVETMRQALAVSGGNVSEAARRLGINRSTLYRRLLSEGAGR
jgi:sigma-54 dependent transcriptional regulator, acetoin dehydrogenase operon transcriptional activator AcoR